MDRPDGGSGSQPEGPTARGSPARGLLGLVVGSPAWEYWTRGLKFEVYISPISWNKVRLNLLFMPKPINQMKVISDASTSIIIKQNDGKMIMIITNFLSKSYFLNSKNTVWLQNWWSSSHLQNNTMLVEAEGPTVQWVELSQLKILTCSKKGQELQLTPLNIVMGFLAATMTRTCLETSIFHHQSREISILWVLYGSLWGFRLPHSRFFRKFKLVL